MRLPKLEIVGIRNIYLYKRWKGNMVISAPGGRATKINQKSLRIFYFFLPYFVILGVPTMVLNASEWDSDFLKRILIKLIFPIEKLDENSISKALRARNSLITKLYQIFRESVAFFTCLSYFSFWYIYFFTTFSITVVFSMNSRRKYSKTEK